MTLKISDLGGFSKPLTRLIEVLAQGIGAVSAASLKRRNSEAEVEHIKRIAKAVEEAAQGGAIALQYADDNVKIVGLPVPPRESNATLLSGSDDAQSNRALVRLEHQQKLGQENIEQISARAAEELAHDESVPAESPSQDWINRFFSAAEEISSSQLRDLWGKVLAGEIRRPGAFGLRTLDFLRNISVDEAQKFEKVARFALEQGDMAFVPHNDPKLLEDHGIFSSDQFDLAELGILYPTELSLTTTTLESAATLLYTTDNLSLLVTVPQQPSEIRLPIWSFTAIGKQLLKLTEVNGEMDLLESVGKFYLQSGATAVEVVSDVQHFPNNRVRYESVRKVDAIIES